MDNAEFNDDIQLTPEQAEALLEFEERLSDAVQHVAEAAAGVLDALAELLRNNGVEILEALNGTGNNLVSSNDTVEPEDKEKQPNDQI